MDTDRHRYFDSHRYYKQGLKDYKEAAAEKSLNPLILVKIEKKIKTE